MGLFDKFKFKKDTDKKQAVKKEKKKDKPPQPARLEEKSETMVTPDGRLVSAPKKKDSAKAKKARPKKEDTADAYKVLIKPLITEKGSSLGMFNQYMFEVAPTANKIEIRKAIKKVYGIEPIKVNVMNVTGRQVRYGRTEGRTKHWKKAIVTLAEGKKIDIQEGL